MSMAQVELMCADCSLTVYPKSDTVRDDKGKEHKFGRPSRRSMQELMQEFSSWGDVSSPEIDLTGFKF